VAELKEEATEVAAWEPAPLVTTASAPVAAEVAPGLTIVAILASAAVAVASGLVWAGIVIVTRWDIGIIAWFGGVAAGSTMLRIAGRPLGIASRIVVGLFSAAGIMLGKYVIFVHDLKDEAHKLYGNLSDSIGYLDSSQVSFFFHHFSEIVKPIYLLWVALAFVAAFRTAGGQPVFRRRRGQQPSVGGAS
jgi:hypothetical protein